MGRNNKSRHERGYGSAWVKIRLIALRRDGYLCQACKPKPTPATEVDHIKPKSQGGDDQLINLQSLCRPCHEAKTALDGAGDAAVVPIGLDGWPDPQG